MDLPWINSFDSPFEPMFPFLCFELITSLKWKTMIISDQDIYSSQEETTSCLSSSWSDDEVKSEEPSEEVYPMKKVTS